MAGYGLLLGAGDTCFCWYFGGGHRSCAIGGSLHRLGGADWAISGRPQWCRSHRMAMCPSITLSRRSRSITGRLLPFIVHT